MRRAHILPATQSDACLAGVTGDWMIRAKVDCQATTVPASAPWSLALLAFLLLAAVLLGARRVGHGIALLTIGAVMTLAHASPSWAGCDYEHPRKAKLYQADLVQAFVSCGNPGGNTPNTSSASGVPGCAPPETFNQQAGTPVNGWQWDEQRSRGSIVFREFAGRFGGNSRELKVKMRLRHILDGTGAPANGSGTLSTMARTTIEDTVVTSPGMGTDMTIIDFPAPFAFTMTNGNATLNFPPRHPGFFPVEPLPGCSSLEILNVKILDPNGNPFAVPGVFFKNLPND